MPRCWPATPPAGVGCLYPEAASNAVLRWEYRPGSTLFVVWTVGRGSFRSYDATAGVGNELTDLLLFRRAKPTHTLQLKLNYWLSL